MESITLTGAAVTGILPEAPHARQAMLDMVSPLPVNVKLGRRPPRPGKRTLALKQFFDPAKMSFTPPASINRRERAASSIGHMYANDQLGDCVIAGKGHCFGLWSAVDSDSPGQIVGTDREIIDQYHRWCGPGDNGCVITDVLDAIQQEGMVMGGKRYGIDGYVSADWTSKLETQVVQYLFGASSIGIDLPAAWTSADVWDVTNTQIVGGHDVTPIDYDEKGVYVSSWGRVYLITWAAWMSRKWLSEFYAILSPTWYNGDKLAPCGIDVSKLKAALEAIRNGQVPDIDPPAPPPPPVPPGTGYVIKVPAGLAPGSYTVGGSGPGVDPVQLRNVINSLLQLLGISPLPQLAALAPGAGAIPWPKVMAILSIIMAAMSKPLDAASIAALLAQIMAILSS